MPFPSRGGFAPGVDRAARLPHIAGMTQRILAVNPGSTSTKAALFENGALVGSVEAQHPTPEL